MNRQLLLSLLSVCVLLIAACGDDKSKRSDDPIGDATRGGGMPVGMPGSAPTGLPGSGMPGTGFEDIYKGKAKVELTDAMMEDYVKLLSKLKDIKTPSAALLAKHNFDLQKWAAINAVIWGSAGRAMGESSRKSVQKQLDKARKDLASATGPRKENLQAVVKGYEEALAAMDKQPAATDLDRKNWEVYKRWKDKITEAKGK